MRNNVGQFGTNKSIQAKQDGFVKFTDNKTTMRFDLIDNGLQSNSSRSGKFRIKNKSGFILEIDVQETAGTVVVDFGNEEIQKLPVGEYQFEIALNDGDKLSIYPDSGFGKFTITQNTKAVNGNVVSGVYVDDIIKQVKKLVSGSATNGNGVVINDEDFVHKTGDETIQGVKSFHNDQTVIKIDSNGISKSTDGGQTYTEFTGGQGEKGEPGEPGQQGPKGDQGPQGPQGIQGPKGDKGNTGAKGDKGDQGEPGKDGQTGKDGADGKSAYQVAVANGFDGDEKKFIASLKGDQGPQGATGGSAVDLDAWNKFKAAKDGLPKTTKDISMWFIMTNPEWFDWLLRSNQHWWYVPSDKKIVETYFFEVNGGVFKDAYLHWEEVNGFVRFDIYPNNFNMPGDFKAYHLFFQKSTYKWPLYKWQDSYLPDFEAEQGITNTGIPQLSLGGNMDGIDNKNAVKMTYKLVDGFGSVISQGWASVRTQGDSSSLWEKKNYRMKFFSDSEMTKPVSLTINPEMVAQNDVTIKANYIDDSQARNNVLQQINRDIVTNRPGLSEFFDNTLNYGAVEGYPMTLNLLGNTVPFNGLYTWNYGSKALLYGLDKKSTTQICIEGANDTGQWGINFQATSIPKPDGTNGWDLNSYSWNDDNQATVNKLFNFVATSSDADFIKGFGDLVDLTSVYDYIAFRTIIGDVDAWRKNQTFVTWDSKKWYMMSYDLDNTLGLDWTGKLNVGLNVVGRVPYMMDHKMIGRVLILFKDEFKKRYWQLRSNELKEANMAERFKRWIEVYPQVLIEAEHKRWPNKPSLGQSDFNFLQHAIVKQARAVDAWVNGL